MSEAPATWLTGLLTRAGYLLAVLLLVSYPAAIVYWFLIHPLACFWRRVGPVWTYVVVGAVSLGLAAWIFQYRQPLLATRWPFHWGLAAPGLLLYAAAIRLEILCRRHLKFRILAGVPEVGRDPGRLLTEGIYERLRHPRYLSFLLGTAGLALILNYPALYLLAATCLPALYLVILLEERELRARFGDAYAAYAERVPGRLIPRRRTG